MRGPPPRPQGLRPKDASEAGRPATASPPVEPQPLTAGHPGLSFPSIARARLSLLTTRAVRPGAPKVRP